MPWRWHKAFYGFTFVVTFTILSYFYMVQDTPNREPRLGGAGKRRDSGLFVEKIVAYAEDFFNQVADYPCKNLTTEQIDKVEYVNRMWQKPQNAEIYVFSAYYDQRYKSNSGTEYHFVRLVASSLGTIEFKVYCQIWYANKTNPLVVQSDASEIWSNIWDKNSKNLYYKPYLISCPIPASYRKSGIYPAAVSVSTSPCDFPGNFLELAKPISTKQPKNFAVCVKGLDFSDDISFRMVEWIETLLLFGVDSITFYVFQLHWNVSKALRYYQSQGKVKLKNLTLPGRQPNSPASLRREFLKNNTWQKRRHELVPLNDCFYSYIYSHKLVALLDLDEVIVPVKYPTWDKLFSVIVNNRDNVLVKYASLSVQNVYFFDDFGPSKFDDIPQYHHLLRFVHRSSNFSKPGYAVKSFMSTNTTLMAFNHYAMKALYSDVKRSALISSEMARLHHYRKGCPGGMRNDCDNNFMKYTVRDTTMFRWKNKLRDNTAKALRNIGLLRPKVPMSR